MNSKWNPTSNSIFAGIDQNPKLQKPLCGEMARRLLRWKINAHATRIWFFLWILYRRHKLQHPWTLTHKRLGRQRLSTCHSRWKREKSRNSARPKNWKSYNCRLYAWSNRNHRKFRKLEWQTAFSNCFLQCAAFPVDNEPFSSGFVFRCSKLGTFQKDVSQLDNWTWQKCKSYQGEVDGEEYVGKQASGSYLYLPKDGD